ncbi:hypothetical protein H6G64_35395 [Calothrix sp. FACHB-156]|nr:hypothetical protein [Calothrix sp. FACHB-156]
MTNPIPKPEEFFNQTIALNDKLAVHQACNKLLDLLANSPNARTGEPLAVSTISKKLAEYKKLFYNYQHKNPELNEKVETNNGTNTQHIAARLLTLTDEQYQVLHKQRSQNDEARAGFDSNGDIREVEKPSIDIESTIRKSLEYLNSNDPHTIGVGIINLTGLRANEQNMPAREYPNWETVITREMVAIDEFVIAFKGISKKKNIEDAQAYHARVTLAPAQMIVDAQKRFLSSKAVKAIPTDYEKYRKGFQDTFSNRYGELFGRELSTIEAYDDEGRLLKNNGTPHKGRAFYACALRAILKAKNFNDSACNQYIQRCLAHENVGITIKYLGRYDEKEFINPIDINLPTNIKGLGKMVNLPAVLEPQTTDTTVKEIKPTKTTAIKDKKQNKETVKAQPKNTFDIDTFMNALDGDLLTEFQKLLNTDSNLTNAVIAVVNLAKQKSTQDSHTKKRSVSDEVRDIIVAIMEYNEQQTVNTNCIVPTYSLINKISEKHYQKPLFVKTVTQTLEQYQEDIYTRLSHKQISKEDAEKWNGKHHRKTMNNVIDEIITILNKQ